MSTAVIYQLPFNQQASVRDGQRRAPVVSPVNPKEIPIEDLEKMEGDIKPDLSVIFGRVRDRFNSYLDEGAYIAPVKLKKLSNGAEVEDLTAWRTSKENDKISRFFSVLAETRKVKTDGALEKFMKFARSYGGAGGPDSDLAQDYAFVQKVFSEELGRVGLRGIEVV